MDRETSDLHISVPGNRTVAVAAVTPRTIPLQPGWNLVTYTGAPDTPVAFLFGGLPSVIDAIHGWDSAGSRFLSAFPFAPSHSTLTTVQPRDALWVHVRGAQTVEWDEFGSALPPGPTALTPGWNLVPWLGSEVPFTIGAARLFRISPIVYRWDPVGSLHEVFNAAGPSFLNTLTTLHPFDGLWVFVATNAPVLWQQPGLPAVSP